MRNIIAMCIGNNATGFKQFIDRTVDSLKDSPGLAKTTLGTAQSVEIPEGSTLAFEIDRERFNRTMKKIAYGLHFHEFGKPWNRDLIVVTPNLVTADMCEDKYGPLMRWAERNFPPLPSRGENQMVFMYEFLPPSEEIDDPVFRIRFYENFIVWVMHLKGSTAPEL